MLSSTFASATTPAVAAAARHHSRLLRLLEHTLTSTRSSSTFPSSSSLYASFCSSTTTNHKMSVSRKVISTPNAPAAIGPYSQAILAGNTLYVSGCIGLDPKVTTRIERSIDRLTLSNRRETSPLKTSKDKPSKSWPTWRPSSKPEVLLSTPSSRLPSCCATSTSSPRSMRSTKSVSIEEKHACSSLLFPMLIDIPSLSQSSPALNHQPELPTP